MKSNFQDNSIYFVEADKIKPNPFQPRREFDTAQLDSLSDSIRMYGVLQPLVVTRREVFAEDGGMSTEYELIAGERRLRASKLAGLREVPVIIRSDEQSDREKLEVAIIENLQREDLNPVDRAIAFRQLVDEFKLKHAEIAKKMGKSREYVSNSMRILALPEEMLQAITDKKISEGHARTLLMLSDRPEEQVVLFKEILLKKLTVRAAEKIARRVAFDKVRKKERTIDPHTIEVEEEMSESLGTRVHIERKAVGGKIEIDFFSEEDLAHILKILKEKEIEGDLKDGNSKLNNFVEQSGGLAAATNLVFEKEKESDPEPTTVSDEIGKTTPFSYDAPGGDGGAEGDKEPLVKKEEIGKTTPFSYDAPGGDDKEDKTLNDDYSYNKKEEIGKTTPFSYEPSNESEENKEDVKVEGKEEESVEKEINTPAPIVLNTEGETTSEMPKVSEPEIAIDVDNTPTDDNSQYAETPSVEPVVEEAVDVNKLSDEVISNTPEPVVEETNSSDEIVTEEVQTNEQETTPQEQPRSKYLEPIGEEDLLPENRIPVFSEEDNNPSPVGQDKNPIVKERAKDTFNEPNVITDFVEAQKEAEEVNTPNYGNDEDDLYSVKGM